MAKNGPSAKEQAEVNAFKDLYRRGLEKEKALIDQIIAAEEERRISSMGFVKAQSDILAATARQHQRQDDLTKAFTGYKDKWRDFKEIITDPKIATGMFLAMGAKAAKDISGTILDANKAMGLGYTQGLAMSGTLASSVKSGVLLGIGFKKAAKAASSLADEMGDISEVSKEAILSVAKLDKKYGLAGASAAKLFNQIKLINGGSDATAAATIKFTEGLARANNVAPGKVIADMADNTEFMAKYMKAGSMSMAETAVQAAKLGASMSAIDGMASSILNIESSIAAEMEASVLLGRQISFDKARQLAMAGDTLGMTKAILSQVGGIAGWEKMSVIQRQALAKAAGTDLATMQEMIANKEKQLTMGTEEEATQGKLLGYYKDFKAFGKENIGMLSTSINMLASISNTKLGTFIADKAAMIWTAMKHKAQQMFNTKAHKLRMKQIKAEKKAASGGTPDAAEGPDLQAIVEDPLGAVQDAATEKVTGAVEGVISPTEMEMPDTEALETPAPPDNGGSIKEKMKNIAEGLKSFASGKVLQGAFNLALSTPSLLLLSIAAIPLKLVEKLNGEVLKLNLKGIAQGVKAFSKSAVGALVLMLVAPALAMMLIAIPFLAFMAIPGIGPMVQANFIALAAGLAAFGNPATAVFVLIGIGLLALLGIAMIPFAFSLSLITPLIEAFGNIIIGVFQAMPPIIAAVVEGFVLLMNSITLQGILGMMALGPALVMTSMGLMALAGGLLLLTPMIPTLLIFTLAFSLLTPAAEAFGKVIIGVFGALPPILEALAAAFVAIAPAIPLIALGFLMLVPVVPFMPFIAMGLLAIGAAIATAAIGFGIFKFIGGVETITALALSMPLLAPATLELAAGIGALAAVAFSLPVIGWGMKSLGAGMLVASLGFGLFGLVGGATTMDLLSVSISALVPLVGGIALLGPAFASMAGGIALLAGSLLLLTPMLPTLLLLGGMAMGVGAIMGAGGGDSKDSDDGTNKIVEKLDILIGLMSQGGDINMDGKKVGEVLALARGPMGT